MVCNEKGALQLGLGIFTCIEWSTSLLGCDEVLPQITPEELAVELEKTHRSPISKPNLWPLFRKFDGIEVIQKKFTVVNIWRYISHASFILQTNPDRVKYLDESHFVSKSLNRRKAVGPAGTRIFVVRDDLMDEERFTLTLCTSINDQDHPCWSCTCDETIDAPCFYLIICAMLDSSYLRPGDLLLMDNCKVL